MPMNRHDYPSNWTKVSLVIRRVAQQRCEWCGVENGSPLPSGRKGKVVLTVAHLNHDTHDLQRENLSALCQKCHLALDLDEHIQHAKETRARKKLEQAQASGQLPLMEGQL